jgi:ABC-type polysaccharide/polyol phosphate export permease
MVGVIEGSRWAFLGTVRPDLGAIGMSVMMVLVVLLGGVMYFGRAESSLADLV